MTVSVAPPVTGHQARSRVRFLSASSQPSPWTLRPSPRGVCSASRPLNMRWWADGWAISQGGVLIHRPIGESTPVPGEAALGWTAHYLIGILFAAAFLSLVGEDWMRNPEPIRPLMFGLASAVVPILLLQPCMGQALPHGEPLHHGAPAPEACRPTSRSGSACGSAVCCWSWPERDGESLRPVRKPSAGCFAWPRPY